MTTRLMGAAIRFDGLKRAFATFVVATLVLAASTPLRAQVITVEPDCGVAGSTVAIGGSGWAEPDPVCEYIFFFDGTEFAPRQPDGLFGPPAASATVPAKPPGDYDVKIELRLTSNGQLIQCRKTSFTVVAAVSNPWSNATVASGGTANARINIEFDPDAVCDVTPCTSIVFIQSVNMMGRVTGSDPEMYRSISYQEAGINFGDAAEADYQGRRTPGGTGTDRLHGRPRPYYGSNSTGGFSTGSANRDGVQAGTPRSATMTDRLGRSQFPNMVDRYRFLFETNAFCAAGQNQGEWLGRLTWKWEKALGNPGRLGTSTILTMTRDQPSQEFLDALAIWDKQNTWNLPRATPPTTGGEACD